MSTEHFRFQFSGLAVIVAWGWAWLAVADDSPIVPLPPPRNHGGKTLIEALQERKTTRAFSPQPLSEQMLSDLLWAAFGVNRKATGGRTAPSAMNSQEIDVYVASAEGLFLYEAALHQLRQRLAVDLRAKTSGQNSITNAPVALIFVADLARLTKARPGLKEFYAAIDTGFISQNVYLFCASEGLGTVVHDLDRDTLAEAMKLPPEKKIILAQAVGFPSAPTNADKAP